MMKHLESRPTTSEINDETSRITPPTSELIHRNIFSVNDCNIKSSPWVELVTTKHRISIAATCQTSYCNIENPQYNPVDLRRSSQPPSKSLPLAWLAVEEFIEYGGLWRRRRPRAGRGYATGDLA
jgi:hypothetical protein